MSATEKNLDVQAGQSESAPTVNSQVDRDESSSKEDSSPSDAETGQNDTPGVMDRGASAWMTVVGSWFILFATFGYLYSFGVYQDFYTRHYLSNNSPEKIAWIGSFQLMMPFALGIVSGKLFDAGYFHALEIVGGTIFTFSLFMLSLAKPQKYYQIFLSQGVGMGIGLGLTFVPSVSIAVHHFRRRRALATGIALSGSSLGAVIFPILINNLIEKRSFGETVRASGYLVLGFIIIGNCLVRTAYQNVQSKAPLKITTFFVDLPYMCTVIGALISSFGFYFPRKYPVYRLLLNADLTIFLESFYYSVIYLQLYAIKHDIDPTLSFYSIAILNACSAIGRVVGNQLADVYGPFNIIVPCTVISAGTIFAVFGVHSAGTLVAVSIVYGIFAGAWLSLSMVSLASLARHPGETGARTGLALAMSSFGSLGSAPVQGALLTSSFVWTRPIAFSGALMIISALFFGTTRMMLASERKTHKV